MRRLSNTALLLAASLAGNGGAACTPSSAVPRREEKTTPPPASISVPPSAGDRRGPSAALAKHWPFTGRVSTAGYVDVAGMSRTVAGDPRVILPILALVVDAKRKESLLHCAGDALGRTREVAFGSDHEVSLLELVAVAGGASAIASSCFDGNPSFARASAVPGADDGWSGTDSDGSPLRVARVGDVLLIGTPATVTAAAAPSASPHPLPKNLTLAGDEYAVMDAEIDGMTAAHFLLSDSDRHLALETDLTVGDGAAADLLADKLRALTTWPPNAFEGSPTPAITASLHRLSTALTIASRGPAVKARFELVEPPEVQAYDVAIYANLTASLVQYTLRQGELAEPRATLPGIAQRYAEATDDAARKAHVRKRLRSYPPVPAKIPSGAPVTSTGAAWSAWRGLSVELTDPQSFQYEIIADRSGAGADVVARGDLHGDGTVSTLKVHVAIDPRSHEIVVGTVIEEPKQGD